MTTSWIDLGLRPLTLLKRLVCPPVSESSPASLFFPPSDRDVPVNVYTVDDLRRNVLDDSNAVDNVGKTYVEHIGYWKGTYKTQHEFVLFRLRDQSNASRKNVMILDPVPDEENTLHPTVEGGTPSLAIEGVVQGRVADKNPRQGNPRSL
ncbi:hypothetical protein FS749_011557 [Ceratobasidium sp. UAMH 11750]|nr:hypothetical protein FS749_011557 [Ceratobasidium sp. UAMH 11750]